MSPETSAVLESKLEGLEKQLTGIHADLKIDIGKIDAGLKELNGTVRDHEVRLVEERAHRQADCNRLSVLESWRNDLMANLVKAIGQGAAIAIVLGGVLFGIGRAAGWW